MDEGEGISSRGSTHTIERGRGSEVDQGEHNANLCEKVDWSANNVHFPKHHKRHL